MGFNSVVLVRNDAFEPIRAASGGFIREMIRALGDVHTLRAPLDFSGVPGHGNPAQGVWNAHADVTGVLAVGGNHASVLYHAWNTGKHHAKEDQLALLRGWARQEGFDLVPRPKL